MSLPRRPILRSGWRYHRVPDARDGESCGAGVVHVDNGGGLPLRGRLRGPGRPALAEGWPSGQWQQTVNLPTYVYVGSNPTPSTKRLAATDLAENGRSLGGLLAEGDCFGRV